MIKETDFSRRTWTFVFVCESLLVLGLVILIVLFSVPIERKLMDTVRELYHAKEVKFNDYESQNNVFTLMNLDERRKGNQKMQDELMNANEMRFLYHNGGADWDISLHSLHFDSHNQAREWFQRYETAMTKDIPEGWVLTDWYEHADSRVKELAFHALISDDAKSQPEQNLLKQYNCYIMYLESKSVVLIQFHADNDPSVEQKDVLEKLCYKLSLPNPFELENTYDEHFPAQDS